MSFAACDERCARLRTSDATTAKPRPASPARAASTAALSASRLVCRAISSMTPMMSEILREELLDLRHGLDRLGDHLAAAVGDLARAAGGLVGLLARSRRSSSRSPEISSIEAEVSSRLAACSSVRCDRSVVLVEISAEALVTSRADA